MKKIGFKIPAGIWCIAILCLIFGYLVSVMGVTNMLNTIMKTAHDLLLNTVFYLMGMCVITGALGKIFVEFGVVDMLQKLLKPVMRPLFNLPGVASLGAVLTFLSDNPAIIGLSQDKHFARYFKKYQHVSLVNFGTTFGMGLLVIIFMLGQGFYLAPFVGFIGAIAGCVITTRLMQYFTCKDFPEFREADAISAENLHMLEEEKAEEETGHKPSIFIRVLNALLDGGKSGVEIGLAIIPGVLIISTFVMMLTFGGEVEGVDQAGNEIIAYTGGAYQGTQLLPLLADKVSFIFEWLFGFTAPQLIAFPITALGAVGAALGLIPEFASKGIIDGNAIAVFTAMGMCWSGFLSTHAAALDSLGYRSLVPRAYLSHFISGLGAGIVAHWAYVGVTFCISLFSPQAVWTSDANGYNISHQKGYKAELSQLEDSTYVVKNWYGVRDTELKFSVNKKDSSIVVLNGEAKSNANYSFVQIDPTAKRSGEPYVAAVYMPKDYTCFNGNKAKGDFYAFMYVYDFQNRMIDGGYLEISWGGEKPVKIVEDRQIRKEIKLRVDSVNTAKGVSDSAAVKAADDAAK